MLTLICYLIITAILKGICEGKWTMFGILVFIYLLCSFIGSY